MTKTRNYLSILMLISSIIIITKTLNCFAKENNKIERFNLENSLEVPMTNFLEKFKKAINTNDKEAVADLIKFPLSRCILQSKMITLNKREFFNNHHRIITNKVKQEINQITSKDINDRFDKGFSMPGGIWFDSFIISNKPEHIYIHEWNEFHNWNKECDCQCN